MKSVWCKYNLLRILVFFALCWSLWIPQNTYAQINNANYEDLIKKFIAVSTSGDAMKLIREVAPVYFTSQALANQYQGQLISEALLSEIKQNAKSEPGTSIFYDHLRGLVLVQSVNGQLSQLTRPFLAAILGNILEEIPALSFRRSNNEALNKVLMDLSGAMIEFYVQLFENQHLSRKDLSENFLRSFLRLNTALSTLKSDFNWNSEKINLVTSLLSKAVQKSLGSFAYSGDVLTGAIDLIQAVIDQKERHPEPYKKVLPYQDFVRQFKQQVAGLGVSPAQEKLVYFSQKEFPNLFLPDAFRNKPIDQVPQKIIQHTKQLIEAAISAQLNNLYVPIVESGSSEVKMVKYFDYLKKTINQRLLDKFNVTDPQMKLLASGGVVRSVLGQLYFEMYQGLQQSSPISPQETLEKIAANKEPVYAYEIRGVGSDFDVLLVTKYFVEAKMAAEQITNSVEDRFELRDMQGGFKRNLFNVADVKDYGVQTKRSTGQGGAWIDFLAFDPATGKFIEPVGHEGIVEKFILGKMTYSSPKKGQTIEQADKQTVRGLRPLLELPFLQYEDESILREELTKLIEKIKSGQIPDKKTLEQFDKTVRNARFSAANNRVYRGVENSLDALILELIKAVKEQAKHVGIPEFVDFFPVNKRRASKSELKGLPKELLMPMSDFIERYTNNGKLFHGTPSFENGLAIVRGGIFISKSGQGVAAYGRGAYFTKDLSVAMGYASSDGIVFEGEVNQDAKVNVLEWSAEVENNSFIQALIQKHQGNKDLIFEELSKKHGIDIVVNGHVLLQNTDAIGMYTSFKDLVAAYSRVLSNPHSSPKARYRSLDTYYKLYEWAKALGEQSLPTPPTIESFTAEMTRLLKDKTQTANFRADAIEILQLCKYPQEEIIKYLTQNIYPLKYGSLADRIEYLSLMRALNRSMEGAIRSFVYTGNEGTLHMFLDPAMCSYKLDESGVISAKSKMPNIGNIEKEVIGLLSKLAPNETFPMMIEIVKYLLREGTSHLNEAFVENLISSETYKDTFLKAFFNLFKQREYRQGLLRLSTKHGSILFRDKDLFLKALHIAQDNIDDLIKMSWIKLMRLTRRGYDKMPFSPEVKNILKDNLGSIMDAAFVNQFAHLILMINFMGERHNGRSVSKVVVQAIIDHGMELNNILEGSRALGALSKDSQKLFVADYINHLAVAENTTSRIKLHVRWMSIFKTEKLISEAETDRAFKNLDIPQVVADFGITNKNGLTKLNQFIPGHLSIADIYDLGGPETKERVISEFLSLYKDCISSSRGKSIYVRVRHGELHPPAGHFNVMATTGVTRAFLVDVITELIIQDPRWLYEGGSFENLRGLEMALINVVTGEIDAFSEDQRERIYEAIKKHYGTKYYKERFMQVEEYDLLKKVFGPNESIKQLFVSQTSRAKEGDLSPETLRKIEKEKSSHPSRQSGQLHIPGNFNPKNNRTKPSSKPGPYYDIYDLNEFPAFERERVLREVIGAATFKEALELTSKTVDVFIVDEIEARKYGEKYVLPADKIADLDTQFADWRTRTASFVRPKDGKNFILLVDPRLLHKNNLAHELTHRLLRQVFSFSFSGDNVVNKGLSQRLGRMAHAIEEFIVFQIEQEHLDLTLKSQGVAWHDLRAYANEDSYEELTEVIKELKAVNGLSNTQTRDILIATLESLQSLLPSMITLKSPLYTAIIAAENYANKKGEPVLKEHVESLLRALDDIGWEFLPVGKGVSPNFQKLISQIQSEHSLVELLRVLEGKLSVYVHGKNKALKFGYVFVLPAPLLRAHPEIHLSRGEVSYHEHTHSIIIDSELEISELKTQLIRAIQKAFYFSKLPRSIKEKYIEPHRFSSKKITYQDRKKLKQIHDEADLYFDQIDPGQLIPTPLMQKQMAEVQKVIESSNELSERILKTLAQKLFRGDGDNWRNYVDPYQMKQNRYVIDLTKIKREAKDGNIKAQIYMQAVDNIKQNERDMKGFATRAGMKISEFGFKTVKGTGQFLISMALADAIWSVFSGRGLEGLMFFLDQLDDPEFYYHYFSFSWAAGITETGYLYVKGAHNFIHIDPNKFKQLHSKAMTRGLIVGQAVATYIAAIRHHPDFGELLTDPTNFELLAQIAKDVFFAKTNSVSVLVGATSFWSAIKVVELTVKLGKHVWNGGKAGSQAANTNPVAAIVRLSAIFLVEKCIMGAVNWLVPYDEWIQRGKLLENRDIFERNIFESSSEFGEGEDYLSAIHEAYNQYRQAPLTELIEMDESFKQLISDSVTQKEQQILNLQRVARIENFKKYTRGWINKKVTRITFTLDGVDYDSDDWALKPNSRFKAIEFSENDRLSTVAIAFNQLDIDNARKYSKASDIAYWKNQYLQSNPLDPRIDDVEMALIQSKTATIKSSVASLVKVKQGFSLSEVPAGLWQEFKTGSSHKNLETLLEEQQHKKEALAKQLVAAGFYDVQTQVVRDITASVLSVGALESMRMTYFRYLENALLEGSENRFISYFEEIKYLMSLKRRLVEPQKRVAIQKQIALIKEQWVEHEAYVTQNVYHQEVTEHEVTRITANIDFVVNQISVPSIKEIILSKPGNYYLMKHQVSYLSRMLTDSDSKARRRANKIILSLLEMVQLSFESDETELPKYKAAQIMEYLSAEEELPDLSPRVRKKMKDIFDFVRGGQDLWLRGRLSNDQIRFNAFNR